MPTIVFINGRREQVSYNQACLIKQVKEGAQSFAGKPVTSRQIAFAASVSEVIFEAMPTARRSSAQVIVNDPQLRELIANPKLTGKDRFDAIGEYLKKRRAR